MQPEIATDEAIISLVHRAREINDPTTVALLQHRTQDGVALAFTEMFGDEFAYQHGAGCWVRWAGTHWESDKRQSIKYEIRNLARTMNDSAGKEMAKASFITGVEELLMRDPRHARNLADFDTDVNLLNTPDGTIDLQTMRKRPHAQQDLISQITRVSPTKIGGERFLRFMDEITDYDRDLVEFHQLSLGACLSGAVESHWLLFWFGSKGRNGKNTLGDTVAWVLGLYAGILPTSALMSKAHGDDHPTELMQLHGKRVIVSSEVPDGAYWHESRLKELTGDEFINARWMRQDWTKFRRTHKHLIYGNHQPQLRNIDPAVQARFKLVPFSVSFMGREDPDLSKTLRDEGGFILHWLLEGHRKWRDNGKRLPTCRAVEIASQDYFESQSTIDAWVDDRCRRISNSDVAASGLPKASKLYGDYKDWKQERGEQPVSQTRWGSWMSENFKKVSSNGIRYYGIELLNTGRF